MRKAKAVAEKRLRFTMCFCIPAQLFLYTGMVLPFSFERHACHH